MKRRPHVQYLALLFGLLLLLGCEPKAKEHRATIFAFGTLVDVTLYEVDQQLARQALQQIETDLNFMHYAWHAWQKGPLARINELLGLTAEFSANPSVMGLIKKSQQLAELSDDRFNPAIGHLIKLWGYHSDEPPNGPPPTEDAIRQLLAQKPRMADIMIDNVRMKSRNAAVKLDLGAIAKGYALEQIMTMLQQLGIKNAVINAGGDIKAIGQPGKRLWHIGVRHPRKDSVIAGAKLADGESIFTSGDYERFYEHDGQRYHHIIDSRSGYPARGVTSVTVIHSDAATADAAATALFIAGPNEWHRVAKKMGIKYVMLIDSRGAVHINPAMRERLSFEEKSLTFHMSAPL